MYLELGKLGKADAPQTMYHKQWRTKAQQLYYFPLAFYQADLERLSIISGVKAKRCFRAVQGRFCGTFACHFLNQVCLLSRLHCNFRGAAETICKEAWLF